MSYLTLPELGEGISKAVVAGWLVKEGDVFQSDEDMVEVVTDKVSFNIPSNFAGHVEKILIFEGQEISVGEKLAIIKKNGKDV